MSTLAEMGMWDEPETNPGKPAAIQARPSGKPAESLAQSRQSTKTGHFHQVTHTRGIHTHTHAYAHEKNASRTGQQNNLDCLDWVDRASKSAALGNREPGLKTASSGLPGLSPGSLDPAGDVALGPDDPGDDGLEWHVEAEEPIVGHRIVEPEPEPVPHRWAAPEGSLQARLVAIGATVNTYGKCASVRAPAGIPADLVKEVEARGWRIIPGGRANPEAEHDSWLAGVPIAELDL
jgi:hypothetical protein